MFYLFFPKLLPCNGCSFSSEDQGFSGKFIWTGLLEFTKIIWNGKVYDVVILQTIEHLT
jgi:hypothetical protein